MQESFDLIVLGTGAAAATVASRCREQGWRVAIVDSRPFGGTCALRGCDPKKVLVGAAEVIDWAHRMSGKGVRFDGLRIDWPELMRFKRSFTDPVPQQRESSFAEAGIVPYHGRARFTGPASIAVGEATLTARHIVVATGARPARLGLPGEDLLITSDEFLDLNALPGRILFVGGGYIAFEFAHLTARAGSQVTILHRGQRPLEAFDPYLVDLLVRRTRDLGVEVQLGAAATAIERDGDGRRVHARRGGEDLTFRSDLVVHAAGRTPEIDDLDLRTGQVEHTRRGVVVNEYLQSVSNPRVYAAGDAAASGAPLTPVAGYEGRMVARNLLDGNRHKTDHGPVASVVFSIPPLASVGATEETASRQGLRFSVRRGETATWYSSRRTGETCSGYAILVEEGSNRILGAHLLGDRAEETINLFALAIRSGLRASDMTQVLYGYPTHASDIQYIL